MNKDIDHKSRAHGFLPASASNRWLNCPPSAVASKAYPEQETEFAREGTLAHEVAEFVARIEGNIDNALGWPVFVNREIEISL